MPVDRLLDVLNEVAKSRVVRRRNLDYRDLERDFDPQPIIGLLDRHDEVPERALLSMGTLNVLGHHQIGRQLELEPIVILEGKLYSLRLRSRRDAGETGREVRLDAEAGSIRVGQKKFSFPKLPPEILAVREAGGLLPYTLKALREAKAGKG